MHKTIHRQRLLFNMVQNPTGKRRGRPPAYDRGLALRQAGDAFWDAGYSATTLDDLSGATGMNRPSLYGAFGDKHALYLETLAVYAKASHDRLDAFLAADGVLADQLMAVYDAALAIYLQGDRSPRGCFLIGTALSEAVEDPAIRVALLASLLHFDDTFEARFRRARIAGELPKDADPRALAQVAAATLNALAVRARAGEELASLRTTAATTVRLICGKDAARKERATKP